MANILIVDDTSFVRIVLKKYLEKLGHTIVGETGCEDMAFILYKKLRPDIVTLDINLLGEGNGFVSLRKIVNFDPGANVIMVSSSCYTGTVAKAMQSGAKGFISKPIDGNTLNNLINKILNTSSPVVSGQ